MAAPLSPFAPPPPQAAEAVSGGSMGELIASAASLVGVDPETMLRIAQLESSMNPAARNETSSAGGLFQFTDSTASQYGLHGDLRFDPWQASLAASRLARDNIAILRRGLGRDPEPWEVYLAHQQGAGGALRLLREPDSNAVRSLGRDHVMLNLTPSMRARFDPETMTLGDFASSWRSRFNNTVPDTNASISAAMLGTTGVAEMAEPPPPSEAEQAALAHLDAETQKKGAGPLDPAPDAEQQALAQHLARLGTAFAPISTVALPGARRLSDPMMDQRDPRRR